jgi:superfamily II DNA/RNA helicase
VQALVLCPTRELADQVANELRRLARATGNVKVLVLTGGSPMRPQIASLEHGAHIVVGTPGRMRDHLGAPRWTCRKCETLVLDEADRMTDMGFYDEIAGIVSACPKRRQTLLFSATYPDDIRRATDSFLADPVEVTVEAQHDNSQIEQLFFEIGFDQRNTAVSACWATTSRCRRSPSATPRCSAANWSRSCSRKASPRWRCTASWNSVSATRSWCCLPTAAVPCWWPPTSPRAAWTSRTWKR